MQILYTLSYKSINISDIMHEATDINIIMKLLSTFFLLHNAHFLILRIKLVLILLLVNI